MLQTHSFSGEKSSPLCEHFSECGGCSLQDLDVNAYREKKIFDAIKPFRYAFPDIENIMIAPIFIPFGKRLRTTISAYQSDEAYVYGYKQARSHKIFSLKNCGALTPRAEKNAVGFGVLFQEFLPKNIQAKLEFTDCENGIALRVRGVEPLPRKRAQKLREKIFSEFPEIIQILWNEETLLQTETPLIRLTEGVTAPFEAGVFLQPSREGREILQQITQEILSGLNKKQVIADLFCGAGAFGLPFAELKNMRVFAADNDKKAELMLESGIRAAGVGALYTVKRRDLFRDPLSEFELKQFDAVIINPPRQGAQAQCEKLAHSAVQKIVMVSCNPQTAVRDAIALIAGGYVMRRFYTVDQFAQTEHCECVLFFEKPAARSIRS